MKPNEYMAAKTKHEELSKHLRELLAERSDVFEGHGARAQSNAAVQSLRLECEGGEATLKRARLLPERRDFFGGCTGTSTC